MSTNELARKARELKELKLMQDELTAEITALEDDIKAHMTAVGTDEIVVDVFKLRYKDVTSTRIDSTTLKAELPDVYSRYSKATMYKRFTIA